MDPAWTTAPGAVPDGAQREAPGLGAADAEAALACARELGLGHLEGVALGLLARFHAAAGRDAEAGRCAEQAIAAASRSHDRRTSGDALLALGLEPAA